MRGYSKRQAVRTRELEGLMDEVLRRDMRNAWPADRWGRWSTACRQPRGASSGQGLAVAQGLAPRHAIKQSTGCCLIPSCRWSRSSAAGCPSWWESGARFYQLRLDEFEDADQCTVVLGMQTEHGRSTHWCGRPSRARAQEQRTTMDDLLVGFASVVPDVRVTVVADRGFSTAALCS